MSLTHDTSLEGLGDCDCCAGVVAATPEAITNRPGLPAIRYRVGTHSTFLASLLAGLSDRSRPALRALTTRDPDDPTIALLDGVATIADVLTFYQERIANECFLRTAGESRSVLELARAIGYELAPGVAAETVLAFTVEDTAGAPPVTRADLGTRVQSVPGPGERPQVFETVEPVEARAVWNVLAPRLNRPWAPRIDDRHMTLVGIATGLAAGDWILIVGDERLADTGSERWDARRLTRVTPRPEDGVTEIEWDPGLGTHAPRDVHPASQSPRVYALRRTVALFGHNAPAWDLQADDVRARFSTDPDSIHEWPGLTIRAISGEADVVHLDALYPEMVVGSWLVLARPPRSGTSFYTELYTIAEAAEAARQGFGMATPTTRLKVVGEGLASRFNGEVRGTAALGQSEELAAAEVRDTTAVAGDRIELGGSAADPLPDGRRLVVRGVLAAGIPSGPGAGERHAEVVILESSTVATIDARQVTVLTLEEPLAGSYLRDTVEILGNVARATHGQRVEEPMGGGDATVPFPRFALRDGPLTYVGADTPSGRESTLEVWVDDVRWRRVDFPYGHGPRERIYTERLDDDATTVVRAGDGRTGARLPTGQDNLRAVYRKGLGREGNLEAGALSLLMTRPLGVRAVENPIPSSGGADRESMDDARERAPLTVLTMDRIVSLRDYQDFATAFAGIVKARATWLWGSHGRVVHVTVAGPEGDPVPAQGPVHARLEAAMAQAGDPRVPLTIESFRPVAFHVRATLGVRPDHDPEAVVAAAATALGEQFSFGVRNLGQSVALSEAIACLHAVRGVAWAEAVFDPTPPVPDRLVAEAPRSGEPLATAVPAQLLTIEVRRGDLVVAP